MQEIIKKAEVLIEALPYIQRLRGKIIVVKFGGSAMENKVHHDGILKDIAFMECVGMRVVVVHGGGKAISRGLKTAGIDSSFVKGLRVTCERSIEVVDRVISEEVNPEIVNTLCSMGGSAVGVRGQDVFRVQRKGHVDPSTGVAEDLGFVGEPVGVDTEPIKALLASVRIPVVTPLGVDDAGQAHNVNADMAAAAMAKALKAQKLVFLTDVPGLLRDPADDASILSTLRISEVEALIAKGVIDGGMRPKVESGVDALHAGVRKIHMIDGRMPHSLLLEIFTDKGVGTEITWDE